MKAWVGRDRCEGAGTQMEAGGRRCARRSWKHRAEWHSKVEKAKGKELPREATHLAITFRLTEAYTEARGGQFTHPQLHSQRLTASV